MEWHGISNTGKAGSTLMGRILNGTTFFVISQIIFSGESFLFESKSEFDSNGEFCVELRGERPLYEVPLTEHAKV